MLFVAEFVFRRGQLPERIVRRAGRRGFVLVSCGVPGDETCVSVTAGCIAVCIVANTMHHVVRYAINHDARCGGRDVAQAIAIERADPSVGVRGLRQSPYELYWYVLFATLGRVIGSQAGSMPLPRCAARPAPRAGAVVVIEIAAVHEVVVEERIVLRPSRFQWCFPANRSGTPSRCRFGPLCRAGRPAVEGRHPHCRRNCCRDIEWCCPARR